jgi:hypothetical protein
MNGTEKSRDVPTRRSSTFALGVRALQIFFNQPSAFTIDPLLAPAAVPEPSALVLLVLAAACLTKALWRRSAPTCSP